MSDIDTSLGPLRGRKKEMKHLALLQQSRYVKYFIQYPSGWGGVLQSSLSLTNYFALHLIKIYSHKQATGETQVWKSMTWNKRADNNDKSKATWIHIIANILL